MQAAGHPGLAPAVRERLEGDIEAAAAKGAELVLDGRIGGGDAGAQTAPTILDRVPDGSRVLQEELLGPVLALHRVPDLERAIAWTNAGATGNATVIFTQSGGASASSAETSTPTAATRSSSTAARRWSRRDGHDT
jgi:malonate-semialdehyde dehydrogenase (acetylating)/methylmalonate-semialdehyde dehydrogenase